MTSELIPTCITQVGSPYLASGPIYIRRGQTRYVLISGAVSEFVAHRIISMCAYDSKHMMRAAHVSEGTGVTGILGTVIHRPCGGVHPPAQCQTGLHFMPSQTCVISAGFKGRLNKRPCAGYRVVCGHSRLAPEITLVPSVFWESLLLPENGPVFL